MDFEEKGWLEILKKSPKTGDRVKATPDREKIEKRVLRQAENRQLSRKFQEKVLIL